MASKTISLNDTQQQTAATLYKVFTEQWGCTQEGACGILGNMWGESRLNPSSINPNDAGKESIGLCQWRATRNTGLREYASKNNLQWSDLEAQVGWLYQELTTKYQTVFKTVTTTKSISDASFVWGNRFEVFAGYKDRNGSTHVARREYSSYMLEGIKSGNWVAKDLADINYSTSDNATTPVQTTSNSTSNSNGVSVKAKDITTMGFGTNKVYNLDKARKRPTGADPAVSDARKLAFQNLRDSLCESAPDMGREFEKSAEMYDANILKGDQVAKAKLNV